MSTTKNENENLNPIECAPSFSDVFAEIVGFTQYNANGTEYVNFSFIGHKVVSFADESGRPASSAVELRKVSSVTMPLDRALALRDALMIGLSPEKTGGK